MFLLDEFGKVFSGAAAVRLKQTPCSCCAVLGFLAVLVAEAVMSLGSSEGVAPCRRAPRAAVRMGHTCRSSVILSCSYEGHYDAAPSRASWHSCRMGWYLFAVLIMLVLCGAWHCQDGRRVGCTVDRLGSGWRHVCRAVGLRPVTGSKGWGHVSSKLGTLFGPRSCRYCEPGSGLCPGPTQGYAQGLAWVQSEGRRRG